MNKHILNSQPVVMSPGSTAAAIANWLHHYLNGRILEIIIATDIADLVLDGFVPDAADPHGGRQEQAELPDTFDYVILVVPKSRPTQLQPGITYSYPNGENSK